MISTRRARSEKKSTSVLQDALTKAQDGFRNRGISAQQVSIWGIGVPRNPLAEFHCYIAMSYMTAPFIYLLPYDTRGTPVRLKGVCCRPCHRTEMPAETHSAALRHTATGTLTTPIAKRYMAHRCRGAHLLNTGNIRP